MSFDLDVGYASQRGPRSVLEDHAGVGQPAPHEEAWGVIAALADGVSTGGLGGEAAQTTVETLLRGKPETGFLKHGDTVRIEMLDDKHHTLFGAIEQTVRPTA